MAVVAVSVCVGECQPAKGNLPQVGDPPRRQRGNEIAYEEIDNVRMFLAIDLLISIHIYIINSNATDITYIRLMSILIIHSGPIRPRNFSVLIVMVFVAAPVRKPTNFSSSTCFDPKDTRSNHSNIS